MRKMFSLQVENIRAIFVWTCGECRHRTQALSKIKRGAFSDSAPLQEYLIALLRNMGLETEKLIYWGICGKFRFNKLKTPTKRL